MHTPPISNRISQRYVLSLTFLVFVLVGFYYLRTDLDAFYLKHIGQHVGQHAVSYHPEPIGDAPFAGTRTLVVASLKEEDTFWTSRSFEREKALGALRTAVYLVDEPSSPYTVPMNKGHETMVYLTYIIDHYHNLSDVNIFMHSHQTTWHNNDLLLSDSVAIVSRLRTERVFRHGYVNLRCHHEPGCPKHIILDTEEDDINIPEAIAMKNSWRELFPQEKTPQVLSQPCCGQFAVSADRIREVPLEQYKSYRNWLLNTELEDRISGRVWEYLWQWIFAGVEEFCPDERVCYCDGYGVCFGGEKEFRNYFAIRKELRLLEEAIDDSLSDDSSRRNKHYMTGAEIITAREKIEAGYIDLENRRKAAVERGSNPTERTKELGYEHSTW